MGFVFILHIFGALTDIFYRCDRKLGTYLKKPVLICKSNELKTVLEEVGEEIGRMRTRVEVRSPA